MKKTVSLVAITSFCLGFAGALILNRTEPTVKPVTVAEVKVDCSQFGRTASLVMDLRQSNVPYVEVIGEEKDRDRYFVNMVDRAYSKDIYESVAYKAKAIKDFTELETSICEDLTK